jgi:CHAT domain-containing protein
VLSACQTALGKPASGEGVLGLVQGFQMAGAKQVIGSLWKVDDDATSALMVKFYELWAPRNGSQGLAAAEALRQAQQFVRSQPKWSHPYYWASWVSWGRGS